MAKDNFATRIIISAKDEASGVFNLVRRNAGKVAAAIAGYFGIKMFAGAISSAADFQEQMSTVQAVTGATTEEMDLLRKAADEAGTNTRYTATQAGQALEQLARAGLNARQSVETLPSVLALAQGNGLELGQAAGFITQAVRGMGLEFDQAGRVADVLAKGAASANTTVEGLGNALSYAAPTANALGLELEDTVALIGKLADAGIDASRAGTALNSIFAQFSDPASKFRQELASIGIYTNDFNSALEQLAAKGEDGQNAIRAVGREAGPALQAILSQGIGSLKELRAALKDAEGSAALAAAIMDSNLNGALRGLSSAWESVKLTLVEPLLDPIAEQVSRLSSRLRSFVSEGVVQRLGEILGSVFTSAQKSFNDFLDNFDLDQVIQELKEWTEQTQVSVESWVQGMRSIGEWTNVAYLTISTGLNTIKGAFFGLAGVISNTISSVVQTFSDAFGLFGRFSETARSISQEAASIAEAFAASAEINYEKAAVAIDKATDSGRELQEAFSKLVSEEEKAAASSAVVNQALEKTAEQAGLTADQLDALGDGFDYVDGEARSAAEGVEKAGQSAKGTAEAMEDAETAAARLAFAYEQLGITSQAELEEAERKAKQALNTIKESGQATTRELKAAFEAYAQKAVEANNGVISSALRAEASQMGLKIQADETGRVIVQSMAEARAATEGVADSANKAVDGYKAMAAAAEGAAAAANKAEGGSKAKGRTNLSMTYKQRSSQELLEQKRNYEDLAKQSLFVNPLGTFWQKGQWEAQYRQALQREAQKRTAAAKSTLDKVQKEVEPTRQQERPASQTPTTIQTASSNREEAARKVELTLNLPGGITTTGMFEETAADQLIRDLQRLAGVSR